MRLLILLPLMLTAPACSLIPPLETPTPPIPAVFTDPEAAGTGPGAAHLRRSDIFKDPRLRRLMDLSLHNNRDLRLALLNVEAVRAQFRSQAAGTLPGLDLQASYNRERAPAAGDTPSKPRAACCSS